MLLHCFAGESLRVFLAACSLLCLVLCLSHICSGLWQLIDLFRGEVIRDESKICNKFGVITTSPQLVPFTWQ